MTMTNLNICTFTPKMREHSNLFTKVADLERKAAEVRLRSIQAIGNAGVGATGSCMSVVEILTTLYYGQLNGRPVMNFFPENPGNELQDFFLLSKGKAAPVLYSILADLGFFGVEELDYLGKEGALLSMKQGAKVPGVTFSNFAQGHGLSVAVGLALSLSMDRKNNRVFTLLGDGELQSGQVWEAAMAASHYKLNNLICFVDNNKVQGSFLPNGGMDVGSIQDKFEAFGWTVVQVRDGHDFDKIFDALDRAFTTVRKPVCVWCHTVASKGIDFAEGKFWYQNVPLSEGEMSEILPKLEQLI